MFSQCDLRERVSSREGIHKNRALGAKFLQFAMLIEMGITFSKTITSKLGSNSGDLCAENSI